MPDKTPNDKIKSLVEAASMITRGMPPKQSGMMTGMSPAGDRGQTRSGGDGDAPPEDKEPDFPPPRPAKDYKDKEDLEGRPIPENEWIDYWWNTGQGPFGPGGGMYQLHQKEFDKLGRGGWIML